MNRSVMSDILKNTYGWELHTATHPKTNNTYQYYRKPDYERYCFVTPFVTVRDVEDIYLYTNEIMIEGRFGEMRVNIPYLKLDEFKIVTGGFLG